MTLNSGSFDNGAPLRINMQPCHLPSPSPALCFFHFERARSSPRELKRRALHGASTRSRSEHDKEELSTGSLLHTTALFSLGCYARGGRDYFKPLQNGQILPILQIDSFGLRVIYGIWHFTEDAILA